MADDQSLDVTISAEDEGATASLRSTNEILAAMEAQFEKLNATGAATLDALTAGHRAGAAAATEHAAAEDLFGASIGKVETATNSAARVASIFGANTAEATERVEAFTGALDGLGKAALPLLAVGAAFLGVAEAFNFLKEGVDEAAKAQVAMTALGVAVQNQGGVWNDAAKEGVDHYLDAIERATTYSRGEALESLRELAAAHISLADAEKITAIATDVAAGTGKSLTEVVGSLKEALVGHGRALAEDDVVLKALIKSHGNLSDALKLLEEQYSGQASAATDTFTGKSEQLHNELNHLGEDLGERLLPELTYGTEVLIGFAEEAEDQVPTWIKWGQTVLKQINDIKEAADGIDKFFKPLTDVMNAMAGMDDAGNPLPLTNAANPDASNPATNPIIAAQIAAGTSSLSGSESVPRVGHPGLSDGLTSTSPTSIASAIDSAANQFASASGLTADKLAAVVTALGEQETQLGRSSAYDATTGRDRDPSNLGHGIWQLDPASGASPEELQKVATDVNEAARKATEMMVDGLKKNHGDLLAAIEAYGPHNKDGSPDLGYVRSVMTKLDDAKKGVTGIPFLDNLAVSGELSSQQAGVEANSFRNQALQHDAKLGNEAGGGTGIQPISDDAVQKTQAWEFVQKQADDTIKSLTDSERGLRENVDLATNSTDQNTAKMALARKESDDAKEAVGILTGQIAYETNEIARQTSVRDAAHTAMDQAREAYNSFAASLGEGTKHTAAERTELAHLNNEHKHAKTAFEESQHAVDGLTTSLQANRDALSEAEAKTHDLAKANAAILRSYNDATDAAQAKQTDEESVFGKSLEAQRKYWEDYLSTETAAHAHDTELDAIWYKNKLDAENHVRDIDRQLADDPIATAEKRQKLDDQLADEEATYGLSIQATIRYYEQRFAIMSVGDSNARAEAETYYAKIHGLEEDFYKQRVDAERKYVEDVQNAETSLLDDLIEKHQSFHALLHTIFQEIGDDFIKMVERMLVEAPLLTSIEKTMAGMFGGVAGSGGSFGGLGGGGIGGSNGAASGASMFGMFGAAFGETGASNVTSQLDTSSVLSATLGTSTANQIATNTQNAAASAADNGNPYAYGNTKSDGGFSTGDMQLGNYLTGAAGGAGIGATIGSITGGNEANAAVGGALGSSLGTFIGTLGGATGGPLGSLIGTVLGSVVGSLFGSHASPGNNPDEFEGQTGYGQDVANLQGGQSGASGVAYFPTSQIEQFIEAMGVGSGTINGMAGEGQQATNSNGTIASSGGVDAAEIWLAQNQKDTAQQLEAMGVSPAQMANWEQLFGVSSTGTGQYSHIPGDNNIGDIEVTGASSGGDTKTTYTALQAALSQIISASGGSSATPVFSMTEAYPGAPSVLSTNPLGSMNTQTGVYTPNNSVTTAPSGATGAGGNVAGTGSASADAIAFGGPSKIEIYFNGNIVGADGMNTVANEIAQVLQNQQSGQVPGAAGNSRAARYGLS